MNKVKLGLSGLTADKLVVRSSTLVDKMTGNASFPTPVPDLAVVTAAKDDLTTWIEKSQFGDRRAVAMRKKKYNVLLNLLRQLGTYVEYTANGDDDVITSSGFEVRRAPSPAPPVGAPVALQAKRSTKSGKAELKWKGARGSVSYVVEMTLTDPVLPNAVFTPVAVTSKSRLEVDNLTPGTFYWFRVKAIAPRSESAWCDPAYVMAA